MKVTLRIYIRYMEVKLYSNDCMFFSECNNEEYTSMLDDLERAKSLPRYMLDSLLINRAYDETTKKALRDIKKTVKRYNERLSVYP